MDAGVGVGLSIGNINHCFKDNNIAISTVYLTATPTPAFLNIIHNELMMLHLIILFSM